MAWKRGQPGTSGHWRLRLVQRRKNARIPTCVIEMPRLTRLSQLTEMGSGMNIFSLLRSQAKVILCAFAMLVLLGMVWNQTETPTSLAVNPPVATPSSVSGVSTDTGSKTSPDAVEPVAPVGTPASPIDPSTGNAEAKSKDEEYRALMLGCWFHIESGEHWIENFPDGTSRLLLKLDFVSSLIYGKQLEMDLTWEVKDGVLSHTIIKGTPQANVDSLVKDFGNVRRSNVLEITQERMLLGTLGKKPKKDLWTRSPLPKEWGEAKPR